MKERMKVTKMNEGTEKGRKEIRRKKRKKELRKKAEMK
jgi:hypothetical protein